MVNVEQIGQGLYDIIRFSCITLKSKELNEKLGKVVIFVLKSSNKIQIKKAVEAIFGMEVKSINTLILRGKTKVSARRFSYFKQDVKKAIVTFKNKDLSKQLAASMSPVEGTDSENYFVGQSSEMNK